MLVAGGLAEPVEEDLDGVDGVDAGSVEDLLAAGGAGSSDENRGGSNNTGSTNTGNGRSTGSDRGGSTSNTRKTGNSNTGNGTSGTRSRNGSGGVGGDGLADGWEKGHFADGEGGAVVLFLVAEGAGHSAAGAWDDVDFCAG